MRDSPRPTFTRARRCVLEDGFRIIAPMGLIDQIRDAGVVGAGGAGFPYGSEAQLQDGNLHRQRHRVRAAAAPIAMMMELHAQRSSARFRAIRDHLGAKRAVIALKSTMRVQWPR